jgi:hypothetical protein
MRKAIQGYREKSCASWFIHPRQTPETSALMLAWALNGGIGQEFEAQSRAIFYIYP